jgi:hypothetical protein
MERMFQNMSASFQSSLNEIVDKLNRFDTRINEIEERVSSQQIVVENVDSRISDIESKLETMETPSANNHNDPQWEPSGAPSTNILLLGDSNSGGKIKFGSGKGTLGAALPGKETFVAKLESLPIPETSLLSNVSDLVIAVGTNSLKEDNCVPADLARNTYSYIKKVSEVNPSTHVFLPGVLPTRSSEINTKIKEYNHYLHDMCSELPKVHFIDNKNFLSKSGTLVEKWSAGESDNLHLNQEGLKVYFSRMKFALRERHGLPNQRSRRSPRQGNTNANTANSGSRGRGHDRGGRGGRGGAIS